MRKTLFIYIVREMLLYFFVTFLFFFLIFFVNQILLMAEDILSKKAPVKEVVLLILYSFPSIIATSAPFSALVGVLMGMGRLVSDREIVSMNALGVPVHFVIIPVLLVGFFISIMSFMTNDILLPAGTIQFNRLYRKILTSTPALELESNSIKRNQDAIVVTGTIKDGVMDSLLMIDNDADGNKRIVSAPSAEIIQSGNDEILMTLDMNNARVISFDKSDRMKFDIINSKGIQYNILAKNYLSSYSSTVSPREMSSRDLFRELKKRSLDKESKNLNLYRMEFHKKFTIPFAAFFFTILAFPLGLSAKSNGQSTGFILGLIIAVLYWILLIGGQTLSVRLGLNGALLMWIPDGAISICGILLLGKRILN